MKSIQTPLLNFFVSLMYYKRISGLGSFKVDESEEQDKIS